MSKENYTTAKEIYTATIDDDPMVGLVIEKYTGLPNRGFTSSQAILSSIDYLAPLVAFLDVSLAVDESGLDLIPTFREKLPETPIIVISSSDDDRTIETALRLGARDFIRKPIRPGELKARMQQRLDDVKALLVRAIGLGQGAELDVAEARIACGDRSHRIAKTGAKILAHLCKFAGQSVSRDTLKKIAWDGTHVADGSLDRQIFEIRAALKDLGIAGRIVAQYGEGYRWDEKK